MTHPHEDLASLIGRFLAYQDELERTEHEDQRAEFERRRNYMITLMYYMITPGGERYAKMAAILADLDRCEHGRHQNDPCFSCPDGWSTGNLLLPAPGERIGVNHAGAPYIRPARNRSFSDPDAWTAGGNL